jgi:hypothetical protein
VFKSSVAESVDISTRDSLVATPNQETGCTHYLHDPAEDNVRVNDTELRERSTLSEYEEYHGQRPWRGGPMPVG